MSWHVTARRAAQQLGLDPRYARRARWVHKARAVRRAGARVHDHLRFVLADPEPDNFTYELANEAELAAWVALVAGSDHDTATRCLAEPRSDPVLDERLRTATGGHWLWSKRSPPYGKRLAWYALARLCEPELIVETGVHDGLGSLLMLRALERNGGDGTLVSFDVNPTAGWLVGRNDRWELRIESSRTGLPAVLDRGGQVGLMVHDSLHTYENERWGLSTTAPRLAAGGVLITDNAHATRALADVCSDHRLTYFEFRERSTGHFYPGGALGAGRR